jgi:hypothetical protein
MKYSDKPIKIKNGKVYARTVYDYSTEYLSELSLPVIYRKSRKKANKYKLRSNQIIDLRLQFQPFCQHMHKDLEFDPKINDVIGMKEGGKSAQDYIYEWHFAHRHGFLTDIHSSGRGMFARIKDIKNHPISYILLCNAHHEEYDRENGEWRNPKNWRSNDKDE